MSLDRRDARKYMTLRLSESCDCSVGDRHPRRDATLRGRHSPTTVLRVQFVRKKRDAGKGGTAIRSLTMAERDYVLGTHDDEIDRLGLQHLVWRPWMLDSWRRAGITRGTRVLDVG